MCTCDSCAAQPSADSSAACQCITAFDRGAALAGCCPDSHAHWRCLQEACVKYNLQPLDAFIVKVIQLYEMIVVRHGLMLVGQSFGMKTAAYRVLADALTDLKEKVAAHVTLHMLHVPSDLTRKSKLSSQHCTRTATQAPSGAVRHPHWPIFKWAFQCHEALCMHLHSKQVCTAGLE